MSEVRDSKSAVNFLSGGGEMGERIRSFDWSRTPLGPAEYWPQSLKTAIRIMLTSRQPIWVGWGQDLLFFYNDAYKSIIGGKHPLALGQPTSVVWPEVWHEIGPLQLCHRLGESAARSQHQPTAIAQPAKQRRQGRGGGQEHGHA